MIEDPAVEWSDEICARGVRERRFTLAVADRAVPGLVWTPEEPGPPRPLVLIGHGASGSKREGYVVALGRRLVRHHGLAAAAIDGPVHGDRRGDRPPELAFLDFTARWSSDPDLVDDLVVDWRATIDRLGAQEEIDGGRLGYWGLSMGTIFGLPLVAAEPRISAAVLGLMGLAGPSPGRVAAAAAAIACPVLFLMQWDDELFSRARSLDLFDTLGTTDKRLHAHPGAHGEVPDEAFAASVHFLAQRLAGPG